MWQGQHCKYFYNYSHNKVCIFRVCGKSLSNHSAQQFQKRHIKQRILTTQLLTQMVARQMFRGLLYLYGVSLKSFIHLKKNIKIPCSISKSQLPDCPFHCEAAQNSSVLIREHTDSDFYHLGYSVHLSSTDSLHFSSNVSPRIVFRTMKLWIDNIQTFFPLFLDVHLTVYLVCAGQKRAEVY